MGEHIVGVGKGLETAVGKYNAFVGSLESQVLTQARRFEDMAAHHQGKAIPEVGAVDTAVRPLAKLSPPKGAALTPPDASLT